ncbi:STAS domain-containing protein [Streptomyces sp. NBC_00124]|uniref:STAS domain-containing protein n=1 Tax=Streptomyces sp. NBC_00124 TaxID=2975662 RepID=UPI00224F5860|nr:STAS domain-containing protein [Streptomyces sp. NBC_00124]MCX5366560.1 STAS domain-containing protein [Streptomyces sp. NBC_00124]
MRSAQLNVYRHDCDTRALVTLAGEIDLATAPLLRSALTACVHDGIRTVDVDLTAVTFCDVSGLNVFLALSRLANDAGMTLQLHYPPLTLARIIEIAGPCFLLHELHGTPATG